MVGDMRAAAAVLVCLIVVMGIIQLVWRSKSAKETGRPQTTVPQAAGLSATAAQPDSAPTRIYAHNLMLRKGPNFRIYVRWLRGEMTRTRPNVIPSFDDSESFFLNVKTGVIRANVGDIGSFLNAGGVAQSPLKNIKVVADGDQIKLTGTVRKVVPLPIEMKGTIAPASGNRIQLHVTKLSVLKIPFKGLLGAFHVDISDLFDPKGIPGIQVSGNDILLDTKTLLPAPHIRGELTKVRVVSPDIEEVYGKAEEDVSRVEQWRNFLRLREGTLEVGKLTMRHVDLIMIDTSNDAWFDLDLAHYQQQFVNGYTRMTPQAGLQIFMPDLDNIPRNTANQNISIEWLKNRNAPIPPDVTDHQ
jgi:hypothetical protein